MEQVQCPNCGGYKVKDIYGIGFHAGCAIFTGGLWLVILAIIWLLRHLNILSPSDGMHEYQCELCNYQWKWNPETPPPPVTVRPDLIAKGNRKLEEEERERRRRADD